MTEIEEQLTMENAALRNEVAILRARLDKINVSKAYIKLLPCKCGGKRHGRWYMSYDKCYYYECNKCGYQSNKMPSIKAARQQWNEEMK